ncbi:hypothetical protein SMSP2_00155 [Limihaloglobus sulfuriphilus]|uniref:LamG-like jellyroll fold domain-containing protein n=1 Tax=Limihaloglobus sulfuriphilus TaxID=1851148 RepID=A0A1Q2MAW3_9BACT|nr:LamG-like jellyroll fold domain-containing protein [Limihaloglobus sulfuriphilus]AQQ69821.1 hypothetical protein SMSP2_00155 [Limihaloglobus sulfuriphilus]
MNIKLAFLIAFLAVSACFLRAATLPEPQNGQSGVFPDPLLSWTQQLNATANIVYIGTNLLDVQTATPGDPRGVLAASLPCGVTEYEPGLLVPETLYYWRVDHDPDGVEKGQIWSFTTSSGKTVSHYPADGAAGVDMDTAFRWRNGLRSLLFDVYLGYDYEQVLTAGTTSKYYLGRNESGIMFPEFKLSKTYYWRVDSVHPDGLISGNVLTFTSLMASEIVLENFNGYSNSAELKTEWAVSGGFDIALETDPAKTYQGNAMRITKSDAGSAVLTVSPIPDWKEGGTSSLSFWLMSDYNLSALHVTLHSNGDYARQRITGSQQRAAGWWRQIVFDLEGFSGIDLEDVESMDITFTPISEAQGDVWIDHITLQPPRCIQEYLPAGDFNGDCRIDIKDMMLFSQKWLEQDRTVYSSSPAVENLTAYYSFDEGSGIILNDLSGNGNTAVVDMPGSNNWSLNGYSGGCMNFDGTFGISILNPVLSSEHGFTVSMWVQTQDSFPAGGSAAVEMGTGSPDQDTGDFSWQSTQYQTRQSDFFDGWAHYAFVKDISRQRLSIYRDGLLLSQKSVEITEEPAGGQTRIGAPIGTEGEFFIGCMDELRIYSAPLSQSEILWLFAGSGEELLQPLTPAVSPADPNKDGIIDLLDFAQIIKNWNRQIFWP